MKYNKSLIIFGVIGAMYVGVVTADGWTPIPSAGSGDGGAESNGPGYTPFMSKAPLVDSIKNTRHNLTLSYNIEAGGAGAVMDVARNNYGEICVYCHTPHGANTKVNAPIWNRTINTVAYKIYDKPRTLNRPIGQPGPNSLTCLSCHDGTISIDSIINMPGSGGYNSNQETVVDKTWLNRWASNLHAQMGAPGPLEQPISPPPDGNNCTICHSGASLAGSGLAPDFTVFVLSTDLRNDHPIGILFPDAFGPGVDFNQPLGNTPGKMKYFDFNGNGYADKNEPRLYDTGEGPEVECASCHDPHGIPIAGAGSKFIPSFLRVSNGNVNTGEGNSSGLCLTCHEK